ncbi:rhodanese-like domain-containing protein [Poriferisphaera sp. WC338]|uniref:rhodanese-like domain-containing protein n=1 Tax=Poriferisphaera sp. WC338 TaxID=3425129 RepID=UPI003D81753B
MKVFLKQSFAILLASLALSLLLYGVYGLSEFREENDSIRNKIVQISNEQYNLNDSRILWVDARSKRLFELGHIDGAVNLNMSNWEEQVLSLYEIWIPEKLILVYCNGGSCKLSEDIAYKLKEELGSEARIYVLLEGYEELDRGEFEAMNVDELRESYERS